LAGFTLTPLIGYSCLTVEFNSEEIVMEVDVFWSFRSPWSYLATKRLRALQDKYDLSVNFRPVYPIAIRTEDFFNQVNPLWVSYFMTDLQRVAAFLELPLTWPKPDPVNQLNENGKMKTAEDQPHIYRLTKLGIVAQDLGKGIEFADEVSSLIWGGTQNWHEGDHLSQAANRSGLDLAEMDTVVMSDSEGLEAKIQNNQLDHEKAGHWGVPTFAFKGEGFFGQDRLDVLLWRLKQEGLIERTPS
jgi:2-hydroxychromene-2-carboxylate isomerase